jgi:hypothetical protein
MNYSIYKIYEELNKKGMKVKTIRYGDYPRDKIIREVSRKFDSWEYNIDELIDTIGWNFENLTLDQPQHFATSGMYYKSTTRKPKAYFQLFITSKGNLALDWYPYNPEFSKPLEKTDWIHWDNSWPRNSSLPFNRIFMVRGFDILLYRSTKKPYSKLDMYIIEAVKELTGKIYTFLNRFVEIEKITGLYLKYKGDHMDRKLIDCKIRNVKKAAQEAAVKAKMKWITDICSQFNISPKKFLKVFKENDFKYAPTAKAVSTKSPTLTANKVKKLVREIYDFPEIYDSVLDVPPPGVEPRSEGAEVIKVEFGK